MAHPIIPAVATHFLNVRPVMELAVTFTVSPWVNCPSFLPKLFLPFSIVKVRGVPFLKTSIPGWVGVASLMLRVKDVTSYDIPPSTKLYPRPPFVHFRVSSSTEVKIFASILLIAYGFLFCASEQSIFTFPVVLNVTLLFVL